MNGGDPRVEMLRDSGASRMHPWRVALGLTALWFAGYALPLMGAKAAYFRPQGPEIVLIPGLVAAAVLLPLTWYLQSTAAQLHLLGRWSWVTLLAIFTLIAVPALFSAADYPWPRAMEAIFGEDTSGRMKQFFRLAAIGFSALATVLLSSRGWRHRHAEALSALGLALLALIIWRQISQEAPAESLPPAPVIYPTTAPAPGPERRVVWVIFDEMDAQKADELVAKLGADGLPHWQWLRTAGVSALNATPPARDTVISLPALLMGRPVAGMKIIGPGRLNLVDPMTGAELAFDESASIFSALPSGPSSGTLAGWYHPYCDILPNLGRCDSAFLAYAGRPTDALTYLLPKFLHPSFDEHYRITSQLLELLPQRLQEPERSLVFLHLNLPHLPSTWAQNALHMPRVLDAAGMYEQNLRATDVVLGRILDILRTQNDPGTLLIVSSDHWWRPLSPERPRPIPFLVWHAGMPKGQLVDTPFSTVNTRALALAWLHGQLGQDAPALADWMSTQPVFPTWIPSADVTDKWLKSSLPP